MARTARIVLPGFAHHITQRGNNKQNVFFDDDDRHRYLSLLAHYAEVYRMRTLAYCLMSNHIHIVSVPLRKNSLAKAIGQTHFQYTLHFQQKYGTTGHLWQSRFYSCPMDEDYAVNAIAYTELNPVRARMVELAWDYPWSSAEAHCTLSTSSALLNLERWRSRFTTDAWRDHLLESVGKTEVFIEIREHSRHGRPLGNQRFLEKVKQLQKGS